MEEIQAQCEVPQISHFCSLFKDALDLPDFDIEELEEALLSEEENNILLFELLFKLLNGCYGRRDIGHENYELYLRDIISFRLEDELKEENPLKERSFPQLSPLHKVQVLNHLCHFRLDAEDVAACLKGLDGECMRVEPLGKDSKNNTYWYFYGTRLYREDYKPPVESKKMSKKKTKKKKKKGKKGKKGKQIEEEDSSEDEIMTQPSQDPEEEEEEEKNEKVIKKAARLRVNLEKKSDDDDGGDDDVDLGLGLQDDVESLKMSSDEEEIKEEEPLFDDHSSDEDYVERGAKKTKNGKRKKKSQVGRPPSKLAKTQTPTTTPAAGGKKAHVPQILKVTPRSARLRKKFGYMDEDTQDSKASVDRQSSSSRSTVKSDRQRTKSKQRTKRKPARESESSAWEDLNKTDDKLDTDNSHLDTTADDNFASENGDANTGEAEQLDTSARELERDMDVDAASQDSNTSLHYDEDGKPKDKDDASKQTQEGDGHDELDMETCSEDEGLSKAENQQPKESVGVESEDAMNGDLDMAQLDIDSIKHEAQELESSTGQADPSSKKDEAKEGENTQQNNNKDNCDKASVKQEEDEQSDSSSVKQEEEWEGTAAAPPSTTSVKEENEYTPVKQETSLVEKTINQRLCRGGRVESLRGEDTDSQDSRASSLTSLRSSRVTKPWTPHVDTAASLMTGWHLVCEVQEDWQHLITLLDQEEVEGDGQGPPPTAAAIRSQRRFVNLLRENFLHEIPAILEEKEMERKRREQEMAPRRLSTRLIYKKKEQEERDRILKEAQEEEDQLRAEEEEERRRRQEAERKEEQRKQREERERAREERAKRVKLREERAKLISEGKEIPPELMNGIKNDGKSGFRPVPEEQTLDEEVVAKLHKVLAVCFKHDEAWPFVESVEEKIAPGYFDLITMPMNLSEMEDKLNHGRYGSRDDFAADMDLIVDNCENYNGEDHDFSIMARNLRTTFQKAMQRFFPQSRQKKDDDDFVLEGSEGRAVQAVGRRYKARREASKRALNSFVDILNDGEDSSDQVVYRPTGSGTLRNSQASSSFQGYVSGKSKAATMASPNSTTPLVTTRLVGTAGGGKQLIVMPHNTHVMHSPGSGLIEVRTVKAGSSSSSTIATPQKVTLVQAGAGSSTPGNLVSIVNSTVGTDGGKVRYIIPSSMVSLLKDGRSVSSKPAEAGGAGRAVYVAISRPSLDAQSSSVTTTGSAAGSGGGVMMTGNLTSVLSTIHQSGGTVMVGKAGAEAGSGGDPTKSLLKNTVLQSPQVLAAGSSTATTMLVGGKSLITLPGTGGKRQVILAPSGSQLGAGNIQLVAMTGSIGNKAGNMQQLFTVPRSVQIPAAAGTSSAAGGGEGSLGSSPPASSVVGNSPPGKGEEPSKVSPPSSNANANTLQISKETYMRLMAENKIRIVQQPGSKPVLQLQPGVQLVQRTVIPAAQAQPAVVASPALQGAQVVSSFVGSPGQDVTSPRPVVISATASTSSSSSVKKAVVVNPWSVNDRVSAPGYSPLSVNSSVPGVVQSAVSPATTTAVVTSIPRPSDGSDLISASLETITSTPIPPAPSSSALPVSAAVSSSAFNMASPVLVSSAVSASVTTTTTTSASTASACSVATVSALRNALVSAGSPVFHNTVSSTGFLKASPTGVTTKTSSSPAATMVVSPLTVSQASPPPVCASGSQIKLKTGFPSSTQRSLFVSSSSSGSGAGAAVSPVLQLLSSSLRPMESSVCDSLASATASSSSSLKTVAAAGCVNSLSSPVAASTESPKSVHTVSQPIVVQSALLTSLTAGDSPISMLGDLTSSGTMCDSGDSASSGNSSQVKKKSSALAMSQTCRSSVSLASKKKVSTPSAPRSKGMKKGREESPVEAVFQNSPPGDEPKDAEEQHQVQQGRSRRNVVNRDYKAFAGFRRASTSSTPKAAASTPGPRNSTDTDPSPGRTSKKRASVDSSEQLQAKAMCLTPSSVMLKDCIQAMVMNEGGHQGVSVSLSSAPELTGGSSSPRLVCDQENVNTQDTHTSSTLLSESPALGGGEGEEVDSNGVTSATSKSPLKHADRNIFHMSESPVYSHEKSPRDASVSE